MKIGSRFIAITTALITFLLAGFAHAQSAGDYNRYGWGPHMMEWGGGWDGMIFGPLMMILMVALVVAVAVVMVRWLGGHGQAPLHHQAPHHGPSPLDILRERFARSEIDKDEFEERRRILEK